MDKAKVVYKNGNQTANGRERIMELRRGSKGTGEVLATVRYWPWSDKSVESADNYIFQAAKQADVEVVEDWS